MIPARRSFLTLGCSSLSILKAAVKSKLTAALRQCARRSLPQRDSAEALSLMRCVALAYAMCACAPTVIGCAN